MLYFLIAAGLFILSHVAEKQAVMGRRLYWSVLAGLFLFVAFRYEVGCDWEAYAYQYDLVSTFRLGDALTDSEPGWWATIWALSSSNIFYPWVNVLSAAAFFGGVHMLARRQPDRLRFLVLLFPVLIINMPMSGLRQGVAIGFMCYAITCLLDGKIWRYILVVAIAGSMHNSALLFLILTPLGLKNLLPTMRLLAMGLLAVPGLILMLLGSGGQQALDRYVNSDYDANGAIFRLLLLGIGGLFFFLFLRRDWREKYPADYNFALLGSLASIGIIALLPISSVIADRLGYYLIPIQAMIFARTFALRPDIFGRMLSVAISLGLLCFLFVWTSVSVNFNQCYNPYQSWIIEEPMFSRASIR